MNSYKKKFKSISSVLSGGNGGGTVRKSNLIKPRIKSKCRNKKVKIELAHYVHTLDQFDKKKPFPILGLDYYYDSLYESIQSINDSSSFEEVCLAINRYASTAFQRLDRGAMDNDRKKRLPVAAKHTDIHNIVFGGDNIGIKASTYQIVILAVSVNSIDYKMLQAYLKDIYKRIITIDVDKFFNVTLNMSDTEEHNFDFKTLLQLPNFHQTGHDDINYRTHMNKWLVNSKNPAFKRIYAFFLYLYLIVNTYQYELICHGKQSQKSSSSTVTSLLFSTALIMPREYSKFFDLTILPLQELKLKSKLDLHFV